MTTPDQFKVNPKDWDEMRRVLQQLQITVAALVAAINALEARVAILEGP